MPPPHVGEETGREAKQIQGRCQNFSKQNDAMPMKEHSSYPQWLLLKQSISTAQIGQCPHYTTPIKGKERKEQMGAIPSHIVSQRIMNLPKTKGAQVCGTFCESHITVGLDSRTKRKQSGSSCCQEEGLPRLQACTGVLKSGGCSTDRQPQRPSAQKERLSCQKECRAAHDRFRDRFRCFITLYNVLASTSCLLR